MEITRMRNYAIFFAMSLLLLSGLFLVVIPLIRLSPENFAFDWRESFYGAIWRENFGWESLRFHVPPWSIFFFLPITALPFYVGWAVMMALTTLSLVLVVPRYPKQVRLMGLVLLFTAYPVIRNFADINLEAYVILGVLLSQYAFEKQNPYLLAFAVLIATIKPQNVVLLMVVIGIYLLQSFPKRSFFIFVALVGTVFVGSMLVWARPWMVSLGATPTGSSLNESFAMLSLPVPFAYILQAVIGFSTLALVLRSERNLSRLKIGLLIIASMLIAPHTHLTSFVSLLAFGGIALLEKARLLGILVFVLLNTPYLYRLSLVPVDLDNTLYISLIMIIIWLILLVVFVQKELLIHREKSLKSLEIQ